MDVVSRYVPYSVPCIWAPGLSSRSHMLWLRWVGTYHAVAPVYGHPASLQQLTHVMVTMGMYIPYSGPCIGAHGLFAAAHTCCWLPALLYRTQARDGEHHSSPRQLQKKCN